MKNATRAVYPSIEPHRHGYLRVSDLHELYWEEVGAPEGIPAVFLHGGPGSGAIPFDRRLVDPTRYRYVLFDQRGAGRSRIKGCLEENTTPLLVADMERLREHLGIDRWLVMGGSWGSTLSVAYAVAHPGRVLGLVMWGMFLGRRWELDAAYTHRGAAAWIRPVEHQQFLDLLDESDRDQPMRGYWKLLHDEARAAGAAREWTRWEELLSRLVPHPQLVAQAVKDQEQCETKSLLELHYFLNRCFLDGSRLLDRLASFEAPVGLVTGRYDILCPIATAYEVAGVLRGRECNHVIVPDAGHSTEEPGVAAAIVEMTDDFARRAEGARKRGGRR